MKPFAEAFQWLKFMSDFEASSCRLSFQKYSSSAQVSRGEAQIRTMTAAATLSSYGAWQGRSAAQRTRAESLTATFVVLLVILLQPIWLERRLRGSPGGTTDSRQDPESTICKQSSNPSMLFPQKAEKRHGKHLRN